MSVSYSLILLCSNANPYKIDTDKIPAPSFMAVIIGVGQYAYKRKDGVYVIPIGCLKNWPHYREVPDWRKNHRSLFVFEHCLYFLSNVGVCANASAPRAFVSAPVCADKYWDWGAAVGWVLKILRKNYADIIGDFEHSAFQVGCSKSMKIKACKEAAAPSQRIFALARIIVCWGASIVAHFARKVRATNT